jgi:hypothetical protein
MERTILLFRIWMKFTWYFLHSMRIRRPWSLPPHTWIILFSRGFLPNKLELYKFQKYSWKSFINDRQLLMTAHINGACGIAIDDKLLSMLLLRNIAPVPRTWAVIRNGKFSAIEPGYAPDPASLVQKMNKVVLKPTSNNGGKGVFILESRDGVYFRNNLAADEDQLLSLFSEPGEFIVTDYIRQGKFAASLYPDTVNTIRLLTMLDPDSGTPFIACAVQRIGTSESFPVDNVSSGGLSSPIDIKTGRLGRTSNIFIRNGFHWIERHPDTGEQLEGRIIPRWKEICEETLDLARVFPMIPYIAWDIALLDGGICVIETNSWSDLSVFQLEEPLTMNPLIRRFFEHHHIKKNSTSHFRAQEK